MNFSLAAVGVQKMCSDVASTNCSVTKLSLRCEPDCRARTRLLPLGVSLSDEMRGFPCDQR
jgi:hypothetical protein